MSTKTMILAALKESKEFLSGQMLCDNLNISRTAVWKAINQLKAEGYDIEAVQKKGYRIVEHSKKKFNFSKSEIESRLIDNWAGHKVVFFDETGSTNTEAKLIGDNKDSHGILVVAEGQNSGKGRRGRNWESSKGTNIFMSLILKPDILPANATMLTLVSAMAVKTGLQEATGLSAMIKWPNDTVINGKKISGILTEMSTEIESINYVVIGTGINVNVSEFPEDIKDVATSVMIENGGNEADRALIVEKVMKAFERYYDRFMKYADMTELIDEYNAELVNFNNRVKVIKNDGTFQGIARGITKTGELIVEKEDGSFVEVVSGEVSVRGVYGYV